MPPRIATRPLKEKEAFFINLYVKGGADDSKIDACEKRAYLKPGSGKKILKRKAVKKDILDRLAPIQTEQVRQQTITEAVALAELTMQEKLAKQVEEIKLHKVDFDVAAGRLMQMCIGLNMHMYPKELLETIKTVMVVHGSLQSGNTKRVIPAENPQENPAAGVYQSLFNRLGSAPPPADTPSETEQDAQETGVYDLYPQPPKPVIPTAKGMPLPGESIDEIPEKPSNPNVITIEVG